MTDTVIEPVIPAETITDPATAETVVETTQPAETAAAIEYTEFTIPENTEVNTVLMDEYKALAKENGLTQAQAQAQVGFMAKAQAQLMEQATAAWGEQSKADKEFGGEKFNENLAIASKAMDAFATPELKELLNKTGMGNHPELIRAFYRAGLQLSEDKVVPAGLTTPQKTSMYPNSNLN